MMRDERTDQGFSLIELLVTIVLLAILTTVVVLSVSGMTSDAEDSACLADERNLENAVEAYFTQTRTRVLPPTGDPDTVPDAYEQTLVDAELLRQPSQYFDLDAAGQVLDLGRPCDE